MNVLFASRSLALTAGLSLLLSVTHAQKATTPLYKNATAPVDKRVRDLLGRMTVDEKVGQLSTLLGWEMYQRQGNNVSASEKFKQAVQTQHRSRTEATEATPVHARVTMIALSTRADIVDRRTMP